MAEKTSEEQVCHECGAAMVRGSKPMTIHYKGLSATFEMPGWYCACGEGVVTAKDMDTSDRQLNLLKAQSENLVLPSDVRRIRKKLGLNQQAAGQILGGGPSAFNKYEKGQVLPSKAISNLLRVLEALPNALNYLR
ncbi:MAG: type II toxin-antitoxin system MqsA family antitoxin [Janthinobacterium lividum]